jgi:hypothetical protein
MNNPDEFLPDELLSDLLKPFRQATIPATAQRANRLTIERALAIQLRRPWWRRSIAVPIPLAIAASIALVVATTALLLPLPNQTDVAHVTHQLVSDRNSENSHSASSDLNNPTRPAWHVTQSYIQSPQLVTVGFVESQAKENLNDS